MNMAASRSRNTIVDFVTEPRSMTLFSPTTTPQQHDVRVLPRVAKVIENTPRAPWVDAAEAKHEFGLSLCEPSEAECDAIVVGVGHDEFRKMDAEGIRCLHQAGGGNVRGEVCAPIECRRCAVVIEIIGPQIKVCSCLLSEPLAILEDNLSFRSNSLFL